jgi:hypothetical protein
MPKMAVLAVLVVLAVLAVPVVLAVRDRSSARDAWYEESILVVLVLAVLVVLMVCCEQRLVPMMDHLRHSSLPWQRLLIL